MSRQWYHISILWHQLRHRSYFVRDLGVEKSYFVNLSYPSPSAKTVHIKKGGWEDRQVRTVDISSLFVQSYSRCTARSFLQSELSCHSAIMSHTLDSPSLKKNNLVYLLKISQLLSGDIWMLFQGSLQRCHSQRYHNLSSKKQNGWKPGFTELGGRAPVVWIEARIFFPWCSHKVNLKKKCESRT